MKPLHGVRDTGKFNALMESLGRNGWKGAPLVIDGEQLVTGSHRYAAAKALGWDDEEIPTIPIADVFAESGRDFAALYEEYGRPTPYDSAYGYFIDELEMDIILKYDLEIW